MDDRNWFQILIGVLFIIVSLANSLLVPVIRHWHHPPPPPPPPYGVEHDDGSVLSFDVQWRRQNRRHALIHTTTTAPSNAHRLHYLLANNKQGCHDDAVVRDAGKGIRLNKVFKANYSRRQADVLIESGRVSVNGQPVIKKGGFRVIPFVDIVALDGVVIEGWEVMNGMVLNEKRTNNTIAGREHDHVKMDGNSVTSKSQSETSQSKDNNNNHNNNNKSIEDSKQTSTTIISTTQNPNTISKTTSHFEYIKYWKPRGVTCTTDNSIPSNIIDDLLYRRGYQPKQRVYPVGRLDKDTSGLILLTSDGRLPNSALRGRFKQPKIYQVLLNEPISDHDLQQLRNGVVITTIAQRTGTNRGKALTCPTLPCKVERIPHTKRRGVIMTLIEGRNRQIRKMMATLHYEVVRLHRIAFMGIALDPLQQAGGWKALDSSELQLVDNVLERAAKDK